MKFKCKFKLCVRILLISALGLIACEEKEEITQYAPTEEFPVDTLLSQQNVKRAMVIVAHDDDMCAMTGTLSLLKKQGWSIKITSIDKGESRNNAHRTACRHLSDTVAFFGIRPEQLRRDANINNVKYAAIAKSEFKNVFIREHLEPLIIKEVNSFQPSVIFTLDHEIGGYGHPEHVFVSEMVYELAKNSLIQPLYIYQSVFTDHMENTIMERHRKRMISWGFAGDEWDKSKVAYGVPEGMPTPDVQIYIESEAKAKMHFLLSYNKHERKNLNFFIPAFQSYSAEEYFKVFDREFFRILPIQNLGIALNQPIN